MNVLVLTNAALQEEVKLTADQKTKLKPVTEKLAEVEKSRPAFGKGADKDKTTKWREDSKAANDEAKKVTDETLTADQKKRLHQIAIQVAGFAALGDPEAKAEKGKGGGGFVSESTKAIQKEVSESLKLSADQKTAVKEVTDAFAKESREIRTEYGIGGGGFGMKGKEVDKDKQAEGRKKLEDARKKAWGKVDEALNATQKTAWKGLVGDAFDTSKLTPAPAAKKD